MSGLTEQDFAGNHRDTVAGKERVKMPVKRTDLYKKATNRQSAVDNLSGSKDVHKGDNSRRKKSTFKRMKERLLLTFKKDKHTGIKNNRPKKEKNGGSRSVRPNKNNTKAGYNNDNNNIPRPSHYTGNPDRFGYNANEADDTISEIFESIIDPSCPVSPCSDAESGSVRYVRTRRVDPTPLQLEGLRLCRPSSIDRLTPPSQGSRSVFEWQTGSHTRTVQADVDQDLSPSVEMDGPGEDQADGVHVQPHGFLEANDGFSVVSQEEQKRRTDAVANRLAAIWDRYVADRESTASSSSDVEGHRVGARPPQTSLEEDMDIMRELREYGDAIDQRLFGENERKISIGILPIIQNILVAQDYTGFQSVIQRELTDTMGWEQVAWYTYLTKMAICLCSPGRELGMKVKDRAMQYFNTTIKPWVESKPNGWETIHEETDVDTELD